MDYIQPFDQPGNLDAPYANGDAILGVPGSIIDAKALEAVQREIKNAIVAAGLTPSRANLTQLLQAIPILAAAGGAANRITTTITKTVHGLGADFLDLNAAADWLAGRSIPQGGKLILQMAPGRWVYTRDVVIQHPDAARIEIRGAQLNAQLPPPANLPNSGNTTSQRNNDVASNTATMRGIYATEVALQSGHRWLVQGDIGNIQDVLITSDGVVPGQDNLLLQFGTQTLTRVTSIGATNRNITSVLSYTFVLGTCLSLGGGVGVSAELSALFAVQPGCTLGGLSAANAGLSTAGGTIACADLQSAQLYARGCGVNGAQVNGGSMVASAISNSRDNGASSWTCVNNGAMNAAGATGSGSPYLFQAGQGGYIDASNGFGTPTSGSGILAAFRAFIGGDINRAGSTATGGASPAIGTTSSDGASIY